MSECWLYDKCKSHIDCDSFCIWKFKSDKLYSNALISESQRKHIVLRLDSNECDKSAFIRLKNIEDHIVDYIKEGKNLYIHSRNPGTGKTSWSLRLIESYFDRIWPTCNIECKALFINVPRFLLAIKDNITEKSSYIEHIKNNVLKADIVVWDDIGTKAVTVFEAEHLLSMIDARINAGKSNIYTSNLADVELHEALGDRLSSRVANYSENIEFFGLDKRGIN